MAESSRDQMLADFQACTGLDDIETSIAILEQHSWNLMDAVSSFMPQDASSSSPETPSQPPLTSFMTLPHATETDFADTSTANFGSMAAGASGWPDPFSMRPAASRMINFHVEYRDRIIPIVLPDTETVGKIKELLEGELNIPAKEQELRGFPSRRATDSKVLRDMGLPKDNTLYLLTPNLKMNPTIVRSTQSTSSESANESYSLHITFRENSKYKLHKLQFPGNKTIQEVKTAVYHLTDIPVRYQLWYGWPESANDDMTLMSSGLNYPTHALEVARNNVPNRSDASGTVQEPIEIDVSDEEETADHYPDEDFLMHEEDVPQTRKPEPLIPENVVDTTDALEHFRQEFKQRYGEHHPLFFVGSLDQAVREALNGKAKKRKPLAIYLHHDSSISANVFCSQVLCSESVVSFLNNNFVIWAWDMTNEVNSVRLISMATRHFGSIAAGHIRSYKTDQLPALLIVSRTRATNEVVDVIQGHVMIDEMMTRLLHAVEIFQEQQRADIQDENEREHRELIKQEQDDAYQKSLEVDRKKKEAQMEEERKKQEVFENEMKEEQEKEAKRKEEQAMKEAISKSLASAIPDEPVTGSSECICNLRIRIPGKEPISRRFYATETLQTLLNYLTSKGFHIEDYKVLTTFPRRDLTQVDKSKTLEDLKLYPQETLILEER